MRHCLRDPTFNIVLIQYQFVTDRQPYIHTCRSYVWPQRDGQAEWTCVTGYIRDGLSARRRSPIHPSTNRAWRNFIDRHWRTGARANRHPRDAEELTLMSSARRGKNNITRTARRLMIHINNTALRWADAARRRQQPQSGRRRTRSTPV